MKPFNLTDIRNLITQAMALPTTGDGFLDRRFNAHAIEYKRPRYYYRLFYLLTQTLQPALSVELGGWQGTGAAHLAGAYPAGRVVSIDHHGDPGDDVHQAAMLEAASHYVNMTYIQGWTWDVVGQVAAMGTIDILFIDGWHVYEKAMQDWQAYEPLLSDTALVICDDITHDRGPVLDRMDLFFDDLPGPKFIDDTMWPNLPMGFIKYVRV